MNVFTLMMKLRNGVDDEAMEPVRWHLDINTYHRKIVQHPDFLHYSDFKGGEPRILGYPFITVAPPFQADLSIADVTLEAVASRIYTEPVCITMECKLRKNGRTVYVDHESNEEPWK